MRIFGMVVNSNTQHYALHALRTFFEHTQLLADDVFYLIDNDKSLNPGGYISHCPVEILTNHSELTASENANILVERALVDAADLYLLNDDLIFTENWLAPLEKESKSIVSSLSSREIRYDTDVFASNMDMNLTDYLKRKQNLEFLVGTHQSLFSGTHQVIAAPFFCSKIPFEILSTIGRFDEEIAIGADFDYCLRSYLAGFSVKFAMNSYVLRFGRCDCGFSSNRYEGEGSMPRELLRTFGLKWGIALLKLLFLREGGVTQGVEDLENIIAESQHEKIIEALRAPHKVAISI